MSYKVRVRPLLPPGSPLLRVGALVLGAVLLLTQSARAESGAAKKRSPGAAEKLMGQGATAIAAKDFAGAQSALTDAYRIYQSPKILYYLGTLRAAEQKTVEAQDLLRRFLADSTVEPSEPLRQEAQKLLTSLPAAEAGEVLLGAPRGAEVAVDGKVVGALPLPLPLLMTPGSHQVAVQQGKWRAVSEAKVKSARLLELRFKAGTDVVVATEPPLVLVADSYPDPALTDPLRQRLVEVIRRENLAPLIGSVAIGSARELGPAPACLADQACLRRLGEKFGSDYVLTAQLTRTAGNAKSLRMELQLFDLLVGEQVAIRAIDCDGCNVDAAGGKLAEATTALLNAATERGRGDLEITSEPADAEVLLEGKLVGRTPLKKVMFTGSYALEVRKGPLHAQPQRITVGASEPLKVALTLAPEGVEPPPAVATVVPVAEGPRRRPRWRIATGAAALGVGALLVGLGVSALVVDGRCVNDIGSVSPFCPDMGTAFYQTRVPGLGLTISGGALLIFGAVLIALPPSVGGERVPQSAPTPRPPATVSRLLRGFFTGSAGPSTPAFTSTSAGVPGF